MLPVGLKRPYGPIEEVAGAVEPPLQALPFAGRRGRMTDSRLHGRPRMTVANHMRPSAVEQEANTEEPFTSPRSEQIIENSRLVKNR